MATYPRALPRAITCQAFSLNNCPLFWPNGGGVKRSTERSVKKSRLFERSEFSEILA
jgi:hypothetical protein